MLRLILFGLLVALTWLSLVKDFGLFGFVGL